MNTKVSSEKETAESPNLSKYIEISFKSIADQISIRIQKIDEKISNFEHRLEKLVNPSLKSDKDTKIGSADFRSENKIEDGEQIIQKKKQIKDEELLDALSFLREKND